MPSPNPPQVRDSTRFLVMGLGIGAFGAFSALIGAAVCPVCVVATPVLLGAALWKRWQEWRRRGEPPTPALPG
jgi:integral membrane sensor domain MASE1